jgi:hypothetical protein
MKEQEMIQRYETELAAAKNKIAEMQQAQDDFADKNAVLQQEQQIKNLQLPRFYENCGANLQADKAIVGFVRQRLFRCA